MAAGQVAVVADVGLRGGEQATQPPVSSPDLTAARKLAQQVLRGIADLRDARSRSGAGISLLMVADIRSQTPQK